MASETPGSSVSLVGQGSFLTKPSRHMVGCTGKESSTFTNPDGLCPLCKTKGRSQVLKTYRLNFTQSIFLCSDPQCIYPLGSTPLDNIITNTADLKNLSSIKPKKRDISELSSPSQPSPKRLKSDLPLLGQYSPINAATSEQAESSTSVQVVPPWEHDATSSGILQNGWNENTKVTKQNVPETASLFNSTSVPNGKLPSPLLLNGSHYSSPSSSELFTASQDRLHEEPPPSEDLKMIDKLNSTDADNSSMRVSEIEGLEEREHRERRTSEPYPLPETRNLLSLVSENGITLNGSSDILENNEYSPSKVLPALLEQNPLDSQMKDKSSQETSSTLGHVESVMPVSGCSLRGIEVAELCNLNSATQNLCESRELQLTQCTGSVQHNTIALVDESSAEDNRHRAMPTPRDLMKDRHSASFESTRFPVPEQDNKPAHILNTSLKSASQHPVEAFAEEKINDDPVGALEPEFSKALNSKQDSCGMSSTSYLQHDIQPTFLSDNCSVEANEPPCNIVSVMKAIEELTAAPLKVCHLSASLQLAGDNEKMHIETNPSFCSVEDIQPELAMEVDSSLNLPACMADAVVDYSSGVRPEGHLPDQDDIVESCQQSHSEKNNISASVQDNLPKLQFQEKCLSDGPLSPCTSLSIPIDKNGPRTAASGVFIPANPMPEQLDLIYARQSVCDSDTPSDSDVQETAPVQDDSSLIGVCNTGCPVSEKDNSSAEQEMTPLPEDPLLAADKLMHNSVEPGALSTSTQDIQAAISIKDESDMEVTGSSCNVTSDGDDDNAKIPASLSNCQIENNKHTPTACSQAEDVEEAHHLFKTVDALEDISSRNSAVTPLSDSAESNRTVLKTSSENTVLPDLLLDIQPEHRMEEQVSAVPSPTCDADLMVTISADCKQPEEGHLVKAKLDKVCTKEAETNMEVTETEIHNDKLQNSISLSDTLSSEDTVNNEGIESGPLDLSITEQSQSDGIHKARTYEGSQRVLQWKNRKSLCWLDCILSTVVQSKTIGVFVAKHGNNKESVILNLFGKYNEATELCKLVIRKNKAGRPTKAETCLHEVRMDIFEKLKPLLKCKLGEKESPVFAFPLLLRLDPDFQKLFVHSFTWNFKCESCGYTYQERCQTTMTTFTEIMEDWRPLNAVHRSPCNNCQATDQRREMQLETLQPIFMLHFVEGLPSSDLKDYAFHFGEHWYEIKTVIRYRDQHFSTWMENDDDTWLESDDLKGSFCRRHQKFRMRAEDIHIVVWERSSGKKIQEESPQLSSKVHVSERKCDTSIPDAEMSPSDSSTDFPFVAPAAKISEPASTQDSPQVALAPECSVSDSTEHPPLSPVDDTNLPVPPSVVPVSVADNISDPLAGMDGYASDDVFTLTLVEIPFDSVGNPVDPNASNPDVPQVEESPGIVLQCATVENQNDSTELPQPSDPEQSTYLLSEPPRTNATPAPVQIPVQTCHQTKKTINILPAALATSTPSSKTFSSKKSVVDNLMVPLVRKDDHFFVNSNLSSVKKKNTTSKPWQPATLLKESDVSGATKKAENFEGFQARMVNKLTNSESNFLLSKLLNSSSSFNVPKEKSAPSAKSFLAPATLGHLKPGRNGLSYGKMMATDASLNKEDKVRKLRLKLLKKLKAKKNELSMLEKMAKLQQNGSCAGENNGVQSGGVNRREHLRGFLQELQDKIDNADNESIGTASSCTSICSSPGDAEFFAELFSPSPVNPKNDSRFLEMLADGYGISAEHSQQATGFDNSMNATTSQSTSGADSLPNTFNQSTSAEESLNLLSTSTMAMLNEEAAYLDSFVDIF